MRNPITIASGLLILCSLVADAQTMTEIQVKEISGLVLKREYQANYSIIKFTYDKKNDLWIGEETDVVAPGLLVRLEVRDKDRYYRMIDRSGVGPKSNPFLMSPKLRKEILAIAPKK
jgi:hypothetical protein